MDMKRYTWTLALLLALFLIPTTAQAQTSVSIGPKAGFGLGDVEEPFVGADVRIDLGDAPVRINPFFNYYFAPENTTFWSAGANALLDFDIDDPMITPYVGAGLQFFRTSVDVETGIDVPGVQVSAESSTTDLGLSGIAGAEFALDSGIRPFVQAELGIIFNDVENLTLFGIGGGVLFDI